MISHLIQIAMKELTTVYRSKVLLLMTAIILLLLLVATGLASQVATTTLTNKERKFVGMEFSFATWNFSK